MEIDFMNKSVEQAVENMLAEYKDNGAALLSIKERVEQNDYWFLEESLSKAERMQEAAELSIKDAVTVLEAMIAEGKGNVIVKDTRFPSNQIMEEAFDSVSELSDKVWDLDMGLKNTIWVLTKSASTGRWDTMQFMDRDDVINTAQEEYSRSGAYEDNEGLGYPETFEDATAIFAYDQADFKILEFDEHGNEVD